MHPMCHTSAKAAFMFEPMKGEENNASFSLVFDGRQIVATPGMSVAAALLANGITAFRQTPVSGAARGPFCLMGTCYDCMVSMGGENVQACMIPARDGLIVERVSPLIVGDNL